MNVIHSQWGHLDVLSNYYFHDPSVAVWLRVRARVPRTKPCKMALGFSQMHVNHLARGVQGFCSQNNSMLIKKQKNKIEHLLSYLCLFSPLLTPAIGFFFFFCLVGNSYSGTVDSKAHGSIPLCVYYNKVLTPLNHKCPIQTRIELNEYAFQFVPLTRKA